MMNEAEFAGRYMNGLDPQQRAAVTAPAGPVLLLAVPGSGKTTVLVARLGYLVLVRGVPAEQILAVTYTVAATREMRERYIARFGGEDCGVPEFRTINGISQKIIDCYGQTCSRSEPFRLEDNGAELEKILRDLYLEVNREYVDDSTLKDLRTGIAYVKNMMLTDGELETYRSPADGFPVIYRRYNAELRARRMMDYDDQMVYACGILKQRPQILQLFREKYTCLCVDESQDTSKIQHAILRMLAGEKPDLFMVGDEDQSIYGFRAAYPEALVRFGEDYPGARILYLEQNYRSTPEIVEAANRFVSGNTDRYPKTARAVRPSGAEVRCIYTVNRVSQFERAYDIALEAAESGRETAFLFRNNETALPLIDLLERKKLNYSCRKFDEVFFSGRIATDFYDIAAFLRRPSDPALFMKLYYKFNCRISKKEAEEAAARAAESGNPVLEELYRSKTLKAYAKEEVLDLKHQFRRLGKDSAADAVERIRRAMGYGEYLKSRGIDEGKLDTFSLLAREEKDLFSLMDRLTELRQLIAGHVNTGRSPVTLSTIHSAKGLEFDRVYLLDVYDGLFPSVNPGAAVSEGDKKLLQEERRLFYVGMTRAKNELALVCPDILSTFIQEALGKVRRHTFKTLDDGDMIRKNGLLFPKKKLILPKK